MEESTRGDTGGSRTKDKEAESKQIEEILDGAEDQIEAFLAKLPSWDKVDVEGGLVYRGSLRTHEGAAVLEGKGTYTNSSDAKNNYMLAYYAGDFVDDRMEGHPQHGKVGQPKR